MYKASFKKHELLFKKPAKTSRNELTAHSVFYVRLERISDGKITYGEAAPLKGLSIDDVPEFETKLQWFCNAVNDGIPFQQVDFTGFPSIEFAFETAFLSMNHHDDFKIFDTPFYNFHQPIKINGLVWMNEADAMLEEAFTKAESGFDTIKFKVGALDFDAECRMLEAFRKRYSAFKIELRLDANGAFKTDEVLEQLKELWRFDIHSIEQPIKAGQWQAMEEVCARSKINIALDEELIGIDAENNGVILLQQVKPHYIILKPTLLGGLDKSNKWINAAHKQNTGWWATSALESNIGLNAICQWTSTHNNKLPQGLGTGSLYSNNIESPLKVESGNITYTGSGWILKQLEEIFRD